MKNSVRILGVVGILMVLAIAVYGVATAGNNKERPFKADSFEYVTSEGEFPDSDCPVVTVYSEGSGTGAHIGKFTVVRRHCFTPPGHPLFEGEVMHDGTYEISAANGDKLWGTYSGELEITEVGPGGPTQGIITSPTTIDGGTGRFADAQGEYLTIGDYDLVADEGDFTFDGWISY